MPHKMNKRDAVIRPRLVQPKSYTLAEIEVLVKKYLTQSQLTDKLIPELVLSSLLGWLRKQEEPGK